MEPDVVPPLRGLPRGLRASEAATDDVDGKGHAESYHACRPERSEGPARAGPSLRSGRHLSRQHLHRLRLRCRRHIPLVPAFQTLPEIAARLGELHLGAHIAALGTGLRHWLVPRHEVAGLVRAGVERRAPLLGATLDELAAVLRAEHARGHGARAATLGEGAAAEELAAAALTDHHWLAAEMTGNVGHLRLRLFALQWSRVLARLRVILAGEERPEEPTARLQPA